MGDLHDGMTAWGGCDSCCRAPGAGRQPTTVNTGQDDLQPEGQEMAQVRGGSGPRELLPGLPVRCGRLRQELLRAAGG